MSYKVIEILKTFSQDDIKKFKNYLNSPFFNFSKKLLRFYEILILYYPEFDSKNLTEKILSEKLNPDAAFNLSTIRNLFSDLAKAAENYLAIINFQDSKIKAEDFLRNELFKRKLHKNILQSIKKSEILLKDEKEIDTSYLLNIFCVVTDKLNYYLVNKTKSKPVAVTSSIKMLEERAKYVTYFFATEMMRTYDNLMTYSNTYEIDEENSFIIRQFKKSDFGSLLKFLMETCENETCALKLEINLLLFRAFSNFEDERNYFEYKAFIFKNEKTIGIDARRFHFGRLIRYCILKRQEANSTTKFDNELFNLYNLLLVKGYYKSSLSDYLPIELFRAILTHSLRLKKYKWTYNFIKRFRNKLHPERKENMFHYSCAEYYFHLGRYEEAMKNFHKIQLDHFVLKLDLKNLMLMTYYELGLFENARSLIDSYRHFLSNNGILSIAEKKKQRIFIKVIEKMINYRMSPIPYTKFQIKNMLSEDLPNLTWAEEKFSELNLKQIKSA